MGIYRLYNNGGANKKRELNKLYSNGVSNSAKKSSMVPYYLYRAIYWSHDIK